MAFSDFAPQLHTRRNGTQWQIVDIRLKRRIADGHYTLEANGAEDGPGAFATAKDTDAVLAKISRLLQRLETSG